MLGRRHALSTLSLIGNHPNIRFQELRAYLGWISTSTLALRLTELERLGLIARKLFPEIPPRVEYSLTPTGKKLRSHLASIQKSVDSQ